MHKKLLVVAYDFAPLDIISSQRVNYFVEFFSSIGFEVDVLTSKKYSVDGPLTDTKSFDRLSKVARIYEIDYMPRFLKSLNPSGKPSLQKKMKSRSFLKNVRLAFIKLFGAFFDYRTLWAFESLRFLKKHVVDNQYDYVLTSSLPVSVNALGWYLKKTRSARYWVADFRDLWSKNHLIPYSFFSKSLDTFVEKFLLRRSDLVSTVSESLKGDMEGLHGKKVMVVMNGVVPRDYKGVVADHTFFDSLHCEHKINIVYAGALYAARRDPAPLIKTLSKSSGRNEFAIHFFGPGEHEVQRLLPDVDLHDLCFFHGRLPRSRILAIQKAASLNLFLESGDPDAKGVMTGKIFELIAMGRPILSIGPKHDFESTQVLYNSGLLVRWEDLKKPAQDIIRCSSSPTKISDNTLNGFSREWMCEKLWRKMLDLPSN